LTCLKDREIRRESLFLVQNEQNGEIKEYFSLKDFSLVHHEVPIFYFYPSKSILDTHQAQQVIALPTVYSYAFKTSGHSKTCYPINFLDLFNMSTSQLISLHHVFQGRKIDPFIFSTYVSGWQKTGAYALGKSSNLMRSLVKKI
jgi:hypothetical protein